VAAICASTAGQPSRTLGYFGVQGVIDRSFLFEILNERESISPNDPVIVVSQAGGNLGADTLSVLARASKYSWCVTGSSSTTL
jgi:hypothetical protein